MSKEARRQREKEARSRQRLQDQAYREAQRSVYTRIYQEQDAMPDDYETAFQEDSEPQEVPRKRRRGRKVFLTILLILLILVIAAMAAHAVLVHRPELPEAVETMTEEGDQPGVVGANRREDVYTFLLVGRDDGGGGNTDTIMVGCFDVKNGTLDVLSIYRDTLVDVPWEIKKINSVYNRQGIAGLQEQVKNLIGYQPDYYFVVELSAVTQLVDAIGGVDFEIPYNMDYDDPVQDLHIHFDKGMQHLSGEDAVKVLRWRKNNSGESLSVGDIGRVEIQHSFLKAMAEQTIRLGNVTKIRQIASIVDKNLTSDLTYGEMLWFGERALGMNRENIQFYSLPGDYTGTIWSPTYRNYQSYVFVNDSALLEIVNGHLNPYEIPITSNMQHVIHGTTVNNQPTLPSGTGLPVIDGSTVGNSVELPSGGSFSGAPVPPDAITVTPSETTKPTAQTPSAPAETPPETPGEPAEGPSEPAEMPTTAEPPAQPAEPSPPPVEEPPAPVPPPEAATSPEMQPTQ